MRLRLPAPVPGGGCLPCNGEQVAGGVDLHLHGVVLQLQQVSPHVHLLLEGADELLPQLSHLSLLTLLAVQLDLGWPLNGRWGRSVEEEGSGQDVWATWGPPLSFFPNDFLCKHLLQKDLLDYHSPPTSHFRIESSGYDPKVIPSFSV